MTMMFEGADYSVDLSNDLDGTAINEPNITSTNTTVLVLNQTTTALFHHIVASTHSSTTNSLNESEHQLPIHSSDFSALSLRRTCLVVFFSSVIFITVFGNTLVILSVITTRRLRTVTNCFVMSLAVADWMVGIFVMPPAVMLYIYGKI